MTLMSRCQQTIERAEGVGVKLDASAEFAEDGSAFQHNDIKAVSCPAQGTGEAANTGAGSDDGVTPVLRL
jgi:hypothetical protein